MRKINGVSDFNSSSKIESFIPAENIEKPMEGKRMGERLSWLNSQAQKLKEIVKKIKKLIYEHLKG
mgnify:CR=1 FL=1